ncbi:MAG: hypothetical protein LBU91_02585 [Bacteroidales bacterium]|jgi:hypothetical protein|nr:hypothetical protein [Bacteroidales bacterium]
MKKFTSLIFLGILTLVSQAQELAMVGYPTVFDQTSQSARMAYLTAPCVGFQLNNRFVKELNVLKFFGAYPLKTGVWSGMYQTYGYLSYREHDFSIGLSKVVTPRWALGLQVVPKFETFGKRYDSQFSMRVNATSFAKLSSDLYWDSELDILFRTSPNTRDDAPLPNFLRMSLNYVFSKQCQTSIQIKQALPYKTEVSLQVCYAPVSALVVFGTVGATGDCGFGLQYVFSRTTCRLQTQYRSIIGYSTTINLSYQFNNPQN